MSDQKPVAMDLLRGWQQHGRRAYVRLALVGLLLLFVCLSVNWSTYVPDSLLVANAGAASGVVRAGPSQVVTITDDGTACIWPAGKIRAVPPTELPTQYDLLPGVQNPCWLQELRPLDLQRLRESNMLPCSGVFNITRPAEYASYATDPPSYLRVRCLPYFYVLGAAKSATTDLYRRLRMHPDVQYTNIGTDPSWWSIGRFGSTVGKPVVPFDEYLDMQEPMLAALTGTETCGNSSEPWTPKSHLISGDNSPTYLQIRAPHERALLKTDFDSTPVPPGKTVATGMANAQPGARLLVILREPGARLLSGYIYFKSRDDKNKSSEAFHDLVVTSIDDWNSCIENHSEEHCAVLSASMMELPGFGVSLYVLHVQMWLDAFAREQLLVLRTEDYGKDVGGTLLRVFKHLKLEPPSEEKMEEIVKFKKMNERRTNMRNLTMLPETRAILTAFYRPYNARLARLLRSDAFLWEDAAL